MNIAASRFSALPAATTEVAQVIADLDQYGYGVLADVATGVTLGALRERLIEQSYAEHAAGVAILHDKDGRPLPDQVARNIDPERVIRQVVMTLYNKGRPFRNVACDSRILACVRHVLGGREFNLSGLAAQITRNGRTAQKIHTDQDQLPLDPSQAYMVNVLFMVSDFTQANGGTRVVPGSHRWPRPPWSRAPHVAPDYPFRDSGLPPTPIETVAVEGRAGSALIMDGRLWHGGGAHEAPGVVRYAISSSYALPFLKQFENYPANLSPEVVESLSDEERRLLGYIGRGSLGYVEPAALRIGEARIGRDSIQLAL